MQIAPSLKPILKVSIDSKAILQQNSSSSESDAEELSEEEAKSPKLTENKFIKEKLIGENESIDEDS